MKAFLWQDVDGITDSYHSDGSVLVIAAGIKAARKAWVTYVEECNANLSKWVDPISPGSLDGEPDRSWPLAPTVDTSDVLVFPNSGCC